MKRYLFYSIPLALMWCFVHGSVTIENFIFGMILGPIALRPFMPLFKVGGELSFKDAIVRIPKQAKYFAILIIEILKANIMVARIVISPNIDIKPGIIAVPIDTKTNGGITAIANTITLTPGTLTIDISDDRSVLYVHCIDASDPDGVRTSIKNDLEKYVLEAFE
ncbi:MAG: Na+/H+ antiporter subunit E [Methanosarcinaceae archaeon]|nr:Na+/H+ antiporter subunit E [Methanosarcinaceae archaeon]